MDTTVGLYTVNSHVRMYVLYITCCQACYYGYSLVKYGSCKASLTT